MTADQIVELVCLVLAGLSIAFVAEARVHIVDERDEKNRAQERATAYLRRAEAAERIVRETSASPDFERHTDEALEQAEPTSDLRRIK